MKEIQYKTFSWQTHKKNWKLKKPNVCQFELTFKCDLHCKHCYSDCYNKPLYIKKELNTEEVKFILDKIHQAGVIWLCFTGGDPLTRRDFLDIYTHAKNKGFIITIFTNAYSMTKEIADCLEKKPPFAIEITLNAVNKKIYEYISGVKGSFEKTMDRLNMMAEKKLPLRIKTMVTGDNLKHVGQIKEFVERLGITFRLNAKIHARLNGDLTPCSLRISPRHILRLNSDDNLDSKKVKTECAINDKSSKVMNNILFACAAGGGDGVFVDPYGQMYLCNLIRQPQINLLVNNIEEGMNKLLPLVWNSKFKTDSKCKYCQIRNICRNCPGKALLETGNEEASLEYFCELAHLVARNG